MIYFFLDLDQNVHGLAIVRDASAPDRDVEAAPIR